MTANRTIRRSEKLPRGSYFFLRVGHRYYAGEQLEREEVVEPKAQLRKNEKDSYWRRYSYGFGSNRMSQQLRRRLKKSGRPRYMGGEPPKDEDKQPATRPVLTKSSPLLTDDFGKVKPFRRRKQADDACKRLEAMYSDFDVKVSVELHKGE